MDDEGGSEDLDLSIFEGKTVAEILEEGRKALLIRLVASVRSGKSTHQEMAVLRNLLKDNGLTLGLEQGDTSQRQVPEAEVPADLPEFTDPIYMQ